jgi:hypothetical protein
VKKKTDKIENIEKHVGLTSFDCYVFVSQLKRKIGQIG